MNIVTIGLGTFGASLAKALTAAGHDVLGVDISNEKVEFFKDVITNTICIDACDPHALKHLPVNEADVFVVCIGHDFGVSVKIAALLKKFGVKKVICRENSSIHMTVLNSLGVNYTINPEYDSALELAQRIVLPGIQGVFSISDGLKIIELSVPKSLVMTKFEPDVFKQNTRLKILSLKREGKVLYSASQPLELYVDLYFQREDVIVMLGEISSIRKFLKNNE